MCIGQLDFYVHTHTHTHTHTHSGVEIMTQFNNRIVAEKMGFDGCTPIHSAAIFDKLDIIHLLAAMVCI